MGTTIVVPPPGESGESQEETLRASELIGVTVGEVKQEIQALSAGQQQICQRLDSLEPVLVEVRDRLSQPPPAPVIAVVEPEPKSDEGEDLQEVEGEVEEQPVEREPPAQPKPKRNLLQRLFF